MSEVAILAELHSVYFYLFFCRPSATMAMFAIAGRGFGGSYHCDCHQNILRLWRDIHLHLHRVSTCLAGPRGGMFDTKVETRPMAIVFVMERLPPRLHSREVGLRLEVYIVSAV